LLADQSHAVSFFCRGSRNFHRFIDLFGGVFVLEIDLDTLNRRLALRSEDEWGGRASEEEANPRQKRTFQRTQSQSTYGTHRRRNSWE
jgi:hypothetical protein